MRKGLKAMKKVKSASSRHHDPSQGTESVRIKLALVALPYGEGPQKVMPLGLQNISAYLNKKTLMLTSEYLTIPSCTY